MRTGGNETEGIGDLWLWSRLLVAHVLPSVPSER